jgi:putative hydroxymethylpyrimidine transport system substrate-binding protein
MPSLLAVALGLAAVALNPLALVGCGEKEEQLSPGESEPFELLLDFFPNADHAGIYAALANGRFKDVGLDVKIRQPADPAAPIKQVAAGRVDLAISYEPELLRARDQGLSVVSIGALVQAPLTSIISLPAAKIARPADLEGKRVGTAGIDYQAAYLKTILTRAGVDPGSVRRRNLGFNLTPALLSRKVDAVLGAYWNYEGVDLRLRRRDPRVIRVEQAGVPPYDELVLVANEDSLEDDSSRLRRFLGALARGTEDLRRDPQEQVDKGLLKLNRDLDKRLQQASVRATLPHFLPPQGKPYGWQDPKQWQAFARWMREQKLLEKTTSADGAFTNELLPAVVR